VPPDPPPPVPAALVPEAPAAEDAPAGAVGVKTALGLGRHWLTAAEGAVIMLGLIVALPEKSHEVSTRAESS
jgi:hypothetical protein